MAKNLTHQYDLSRKYYVSKTIWFCEKIQKRRIKILNIDTVKKLVNMFTKGIPRDMFQHLQKKIIRWWLSPINRNSLSIGIFEINLSFDRYSSLDRKL